MNRVVDLAKSQESMNPFERDRGRGSAIRLKEAGTESEVIGRLDRLQTGPGKPCATALAMGADPVAILVRGRPMNVHTDIERGRGQDPQGGDRRRTAGLVLPAKAGDRQLT